MPRSSDISARRCRGSIRIGITRRTTSCVRGFCIPLTMGILDRKQATIDATLLAFFVDGGRAGHTSGRENLLGSGDALRSTRRAGGGRDAARDGLPGALLHAAVARRACSLSGGGVAGGQSAASGGGERAVLPDFTEGLFGIRPTGLNAFVATPRLPREWDRMALRKIHAFGTVFDLEVSRAGGKLRVDVVREEKRTQSEVFEDGASVRIVPGA